MMTETYEDQIEKFIHSYNAMRHQLAEAKARCKRSTHAEKRERALYKKAAKLRGFETDAAQQREWEASAAYQKWIDEDIDAVLSRDRLQGDVDSGEMEWETWRTRRADRRAEINLR
jgi:hypothetical protein